MTYHSKINKPSVYKHNFPWNNPRPRTAWSLEEMLKSFQIGDFDDILTGLRHLTSELDNCLAQFGPDDKLYPTWHGHGTKAISLLDQASTLANSMQLKPVFDRAIRAGVLAKEQDCVIGELYRRIRDLCEVIEDELKGKKFLFLVPIRERYFDSKQLFGEEVEKKFPLAKYDLREAGNCFALELYTACVFHLMRVLERGLRALAEELDVTFGHECWGDAIRNIRDKIAIPDKSSKTPEKEARKKFYAEIATEFEYFKTAWRNYVMHDWEYYQEEDAERIMLHVRDFMKQLATRLSV